MNVRLLALAGVMVCAVALPLAVASAGQVGDSAVHPARQDDEKLPLPVRSPLVLGLGLATAARCGPELTSPDGVEAQTCVMAQGADTWARTYYRNATGAALEGVLSLLGPHGRTVQTHCAADAAGDDEPATCETPREHTRGALDAYTAVTEFAARDGGPLLLRSASNSADAGAGDPVAGNSQRSNGS
ncbi:MAG: hypothetical protein JF597_40430 [Streptomyces sp.]|uniref:hypothetical protein n=1 Tax=Streptomyces sp. TaxID=1931 RepID=UPI0025D008B8|nr:hypothetical protein [Streptomyces sp.]MBW8799623.1 hypothetical protein [Streptomyces sp.]